MSVYVLASYEITDGDKYQQYVAGVIPLLQKHQAEVLVAEPAALALEGDGGRHYIVLRFETEQAALAWYNDPAYEPVRKLRLDATGNGHLAIARQWGT
jgi:uncharacterized protein (DUF1330 family)